MLPQKQCENKQLQKCAKFEHKIHKIIILIRHFMTAPWHTDIYNDTLHKTV